MVYHVKDTKNELVDTLLSMNVGDTVEVEYSKQNESKVRQITSAMTKSYTVKYGARKYRTSTYRSQLGIIDVARVM